MFDMKSKPNDNLHRLGSNIDGNGPVTGDEMIATNFNIGQRRGHLGGAARSGDFVLAAAEVDTNDFDAFFGDDNTSSTNGMINVIKARGQELIDVNHYTNNA